MFHKSSLLPSSLSLSPPNRDRIILMASGNRGLTPQPSSLCVERRRSSMKQNNGNKTVRFGDLWSRSSGSSAPALTESSFSSSSHEETLSKAPGRVVRYTSQKHWKRLSLVLDELADIKAVIGELSFPDDLLSGGSALFKHENALHLACRNAAPLSILQKLVSLSPRLPFLVDKLKRTPLHHFCAMHYSHDYYCYYSCGSTVEHVLRYLLETNQRAAEVKDVDGRTALHLSCAGNVRGYDGTLLLDAEVRMSVSPPIVRNATHTRRDTRARKATTDESFPLTKNTIHPYTIKALCQVHPFAVNEEDVYGITPIEYAVDTCVEYEVLASMWKVSGLQWKQQQQQRVRPMEEEEQETTPVTSPETTAIGRQRRGSLRPITIVSRTA